MMSKKNKNKGTTWQTLVRTKIPPRKSHPRDRKIFEKVYRNHACLARKDTYQSAVGLIKLEPNDIRDHLALECKTIEHQIVALRNLTRLTKQNVNRRRMVTQFLLDCLREHHKVIYEAILFGSTINGLGFSDSDLDLRLRPLKNIGNQVLEPIHYDKDFAERTLRDIAFQTTRCAPAMGEFVPSTRCPIAKLTLLKGDPKVPESLQEGLSYDISLSCTRSLGSFNSVFIRFLCRLSTKFHMMATVLRYWSKVHEVVVSGYMSSYALVNMLIFFCQNISPPLLPTVDRMRDIQVAQEKKIKSNGSQATLNAMTQLEWLCTVCLDKKLYPRSSNTEPMGLLLLKFFEFYLNFTYSTNIITIRTGKAIPIQEFRTGNLYHPRYPIKEFINIQDPFDLKHNLTCGMTGEHFNKLIIAFRYSYDKLYNELLANFFRPRHLLKAQQQDQSKSSEKKTREGFDHKDWGVNAIFVKLTPAEIQNAS